MPFLIFDSVESVTISFPVLTFNCIIHRIIWQLKVFLSAAQFDIANAIFNLHMPSSLLQRDNHSSRETIFLAKIVYNFKLQIDCVVVLLKCYAFFDNLFHNLTRQSTQVEKNGSIVLTKPSISSLHSPLFTPVLFLVSMKGNEETRTSQKKQKS